MRRVCGAAAYTFVLLTKINNFLFWQWVTLRRVYRTHKVYIVVTRSCFGVCLCKCPHLFPHRDTSVVFVGGKIFPGAKHTEGWVHLVLWALLSAKSRKCNSIASAKKMCLLLHTGGQDYFHCVIRRGKSEIKRKYAQCLKVPTVPNWSPGAAILHSCEEWNDLIQGGYFYFFKQRGGMAVWEFHQRPEEDIYWAAALFDQEANTHNLVLSQQNQKWWDFW